MGSSMRQIDGYINVGSDKRTDNEHFREWYEAGISGARGSALSNVRGFDFIVADRAASYKTTRYHEYISLVDARQSDIL